MAGGLKSRPYRLAKGGKNMTQYSILGRLRLMIELDEEGAREALPFCAAAMEQLSPQLKVECKNDPRLNQAAAAMACCMLLQRAQGRRDDGDGISSFKAGDITVTKQQGGASKKDGLAYAEQARRAAMEDIRDLMKDTGFFAGQTAFTPPAPPRTTPQSLPASRGPRKRGANKRGQKK